MKSYSQNLFKLKCTHLNIKYWKRPLLMKTVLFSALLSQFNFGKIKIHLWKSFIDFLHGKCLLCSDPRAGVNNEVIQRATSLPNMVCHMKHIGFRRNPADLGVGRWTVPHLVDKGVGPSAGMWLRRPWVSISSTRQHLKQQPTDTWTRSVQSRICFQQEKDTTG